jgi:hypothetical protein
MESDFVGQASPQELQITQRIRSICQYFSLGSTQSAPVGHLRWQSLQAMQVAGLITMCPRVSFVRFAGLIGYIRVAGLVTRLFRTVFAIWKSPIAITAPYS